MAMQAALRRLARRASKSPLAFGVPFMGMVVLGAYGLSFLTQVKYDYIDAKYRTLEKREELGLDKSKEPTDIRKIYFDLVKDDDDWDFVRVPRPKGA